MHRNSILSFVVVAAGIGLLLAGTANSQLAPPKSYVGLQPATPGSSQSGHANVSGTMRAGQFVGGGAGLTSVTAASLALPYSASLTYNTVGQGIIDIRNTSAVGGTVGIRGWASSNNSTTAGVYGLADGGVDHGGCGPAASYATRMAAG